MKKIWILSAILLLLIIICTWCNVGTIASELKEKQTHKKLIPSQMHPVVYKNELAKLQERHVEVSKSLNSFESIAFASGSDQILPESQSVIAKITEILKNHPSLFIEVGGHTDSDGDERFNLTLSQKRADSVKAELISHGISSHRITAKGYGESKPLIKGDTPEAKEKNRRVEYTIIGE
jgi:outer membrane protein OmpA-like peptidoglycan-associated protein